MTAAPAVTREQAIAAAAQVIAEDLQRQLERPPREAAVASLGRYATEAEITAWIQRFRAGQAVTIRDTA